MPKYPDIKVQLVGQNGNAFFIIGRCLEALRKAGISKEEQDTFQKEATSGDYNHLLCVCAEWFNVE